MNLSMCGLDGTWRPRAFFTVATFWHMYVPYGDHTSTMVTIRRIAYGMMRGALKHTDARLLNESNEVLVTR